MKNRLILTFLILLICYPLFAQVRRPVEKKVLNKRIYNATLFDHQGKEFKIYSLFEKGKALILSPLYTKCPHTCPLITSSLREVVEKLYSRGITNFKVLTVSFDDSDSPQDLKNYIEKYEIQKFVEEGIWIVSAGKPQEVKKLLDSIDFVFVKHENGIFDHPNLIAVLTPDARVSKFIYGISYDYSEVLLAINKALKKKGVGGYNIALFVFGLIALTSLLIYTLREAIKATDKKWETK